MDYLLCNDRIAAKFFNAKMAGRRVYLRVTTELICEIGKEHGVGMVGFIRPKMKPVIVLAIVLVGFLAGVPAAFMAAVGTAVLLITRTTEPRLVYDEVDWGLLLFFVGLIIIVGGAERAGLTANLLRPIAAWNLHRTWILSSLTALLSNIVSNVPHRLHMVLAENSGYSGSK